MILLNFLINIFVLEKHNVHEKSVVTISILYSNHYFPEIDFVVYFFAYKCCLFSSFFSFSFFLSFFFLPLFFFVFSFFIDFQKLIYCLPFLFMLLLLPMETNNIILDCSRCGILVSEKSPHIIITAELSKDM